MLHLKSCINSNDIYSVLQAAKHPNKAPELLLGSTDVSLAADMFSLGCIFGEMVTKKPLFSLGDDDVQLRSIFKYDTLYVYPLLGLKFPSFHIS